MKFKFSHHCVGLLILTCLLIADRNQFAIADHSIQSEKISQNPNNSGYSPIELKPYPNSVYDANFSADGKFIITAFDNGTARIWDISGKLKTELKGNLNELKTASFSPNNQLIITSSGGASLLWDTSGNLLAKIKGGSGKFSFDSKLILTTLLNAKLWNTSGKLIAEFNGDKDDPVMSANFSPDSQLIVTAFRSGAVRVWNTSGKLITKFIGDRNLVKSAIFSPDGKLIFTTSFGVSRLWDTSGKMLTELKGRHLSIQSANFSPDSKLIVTTSLNSSDIFNRTAQVWDTNGNLLTELKGHQGDVTGANFSPDGQRIVTVSHDGTARLWNTSGKVLATFIGHQGYVTKASFSPDGKLIVTAADDGTSRLWNIDGKQIAALNLDTQIASSPNVEADRLRDLEFYAPNCALAFEPWQKALKIYQEIADNENQAIILEKLGNAYYCLSDYTNAINFYTQASSIAQQHNYPEIQARNLSNLGSVYNSLADYEQAIKSYEDALKLLQQQDTQLKAEILRGLGNVYNSQGKYSEAINDYSQALAIEEKWRNAAGIAKNKVNLANVYYVLGDYSKAIQYYKETLDLTPSESLAGLGNTYLSLGDTAKAIELHNQSLAKARQIEDKQAEGNALNNLAYALIKANNLPEAEKNLFAAIKLWESLRAGLNDANKVSIFEKQSRTYRLLQEVLIAQNKINEALEIAERGRSRAFVELLSRRLSPNQTQQSNITPPNIEQIKQIAKSQNATLVQYSIVNQEDKQQIKESEIYIWVVKPTGEVAFHRQDIKLLLQKENKTLAQLVDISRQSIGVRGIFEPTDDGANQTKRLQQLYDLLIKPIANQLPSNPSDRIIFIPQGSLFLVPFPALQDAQNKYLVEKHTILTAPSIQLLDLTRQQKQAQQKKSASLPNLVVGNPTMPFVSLVPGGKPQQLPPLKGAEEEAKAIAPLLNTKAITGSQATETAIAQKMTQSRIIHLATHGFFDDLRGLGSAIALAPAGKDDGLLTAEEILDLKLQAELVVLSACDTGRGKITGDGVIGLSRSFISAGVPSIVVSLWQVPDTPTASLMTDFYQNLSKNRDKAAALRQAMLTTMKTHPDPVNWAAFTLIGEVN
ncbi:WD-40 repeat-containing protein [Calothrix brevissima NIES-22]|nr:WD-40 repeat-containing protein [Calothrix brevissima NIES-22]